MVKTIRHHRTIALIVALYLLAGGIYGVSSPIFEVSDELRHVALIEHYARGNGFPVQDPKNLGFYEQEGSQPPLYYVSMAALAQLFDLSDFRQIAQLNPHEHNIGRADATDNQNMLLPMPADNFPWRGTALFVHIARLLGVLMGAITVICTYCIARNLASPSVAIVAASLVAFNPMFVFISASVNNDTLVSMLAALALLLATRALKNGLTSRRAMLLGLVLGCAALTKASALVPVMLIPAALLLNQVWAFRPITAQTMAQVLRQRRFLGQMALCVGFILILAGWWYARNQMLYGDFSATRIQAEIDGFRNPVPTVWDLIGEWNGFHQAYWGLFGAVNIPMHTWVYRAFETMLIAAAFGWLFAIYDWRFMIAAERNLNHQFAVLLCWAIVAANFAALVRWTMLTYASQGRLLFPAIAAISVLLALGLAQIGHILKREGAKHAKIKNFFRVIRPFSVLMSFLIPGALAMLTLAAPFLYIRPAYAPPPQLSNEAALPADLIRTEQSYAEGMRWIGYRVDADSGRVAPNGLFGVTLYWQALRPIPRDYSAFIKLYARDEAEVASLNTYPGGGLLPTSRWQVGNVIVDHYQLRLRDQITPPTVLKLDVGFYRFEDPIRQPLQTQDSKGNPTGRQRYEVAGVGRNNPSQEAATGKAIGYFTLDSSWQRDAAAYVSVTRAERQGQQLYLQTHWVIQRDFAEDYTIFAQLFDASGKLVAQKDGRAMNAQFSTKWWREGDFVLDERMLDLPANLPAGNYTLLMGLYRPSDFSRVPALLPDGTSAKDNALSYGLIIN